MKKKKTKSKNETEESKNPILDENSIYQISYSTKTSGEEAAKLRKENIILKKMLTSYFLVDLENQGYSIGSDE